MTIKRGTYRFTYTGSDYTTWLDDRFGDACRYGLKGYLIGDEDEGMIVLEGPPADVDALSDDIDQDTDIDNFDALLEESNVTGRFQQFAEFRPEDSCDKCS